jgi:hypothetical protein
MQFNHKPAFYDIVIIAVILIIAILLYAIVNLTSEKSPEDWVEVRQYGETILRLSPQDLNNDGIYDFKFDKGIGQIEVSDKKVRMLPMDKTICPKTICSDTGWIESKPAAIICVPNLLIISFNGNKNPKVDIII